MIITNTWSDDDARKFMGGVSKYTSESRVAYCELVGLTPLWVSSASEKELICAIENLRLQKDLEEAKLTHVRRGRLTLFIRYG